MTNAEQTFPALTVEAVMAKFPEFKNLEATHGKLKAIRVDDKIGLFKKPTRQIIGMASALSTTDPMKYLEMLAENCMVAGDKELLEDDDCFMAIMPFLNMLIETKTAELLKL
jgi:hypothetical protein